MALIEEKPLYSSRTIKTYTEYLKKRYPKVNRNAIIKHAGINPYELEDPGHWLTQSQVNLFHQKLDEETGDPNIARDAGRFSVESGALAVVRQYVIGFINPFRAFSALGKIAEIVTRASTFHVSKLSDNRIEIAVHPRPGVKEEKFQCENRIGTIEAMLKFYTGRYPEIDHSVCVHKGDSYCKYIFTLKKTPLSFWKHVQRMTVLLLIPVLFSVFFIPPLAWVLLLSIYVSTLATVSFVSESLAHKQVLSQMEEQGNSAERLLDQIKKGYNNALLIQEISKAISTTMDVDELLAHLMKILENHLDFDRGGIMLSNPEKTRLAYRIGFGINPEYQDYLKKIEFNLEKSNPRSPFSACFKEQKPLLVDKLSEIENDISPKSRDFARMMKSESFICVPIVYKGETFGVLIVDNIRSKRNLSQSDINLLTGVANQIGVSINNSLSYEKIRDSEERFRSLSENAPDIIITLDENASITYVNPAWEKLLGHQKEEILGRDFMNFTGSDHDRTFRQVFKAVWDKKEVVTNFESALKHKEGSERLFSYNCAPNTDSGDRVVGIVCILKDITDQRTLETMLRQAQKMEAMGTLAGGIAHDFNNILTIVMGFTELILRDMTPEHQNYRHLSQILQASIRAKELIHQILTFSRQTEKQLQPLTPSVIVKETAKFMRASIPATIDIQTDIEARDNILADPTQIQQVLMNLCTNAAHSMSHSGGTLRIGLCRVDSIPERAIHAHAGGSSGPYLELSVSDTGHGIDRNIIDRIFDPFFTTKKPGEGTGMGLSVVHGIVKSHKGAILVESALGKGTVFRLYFPVSQDEMRESSESAEIVGGSERILFIDDEQPIIELGKEMLERLGYKVTGVTSSAEALERFRLNPDLFDFIITDFAMPGLTGLELSREALAIRPGIPIIICTGFSDVIDYDQIKSSGIRGVLLKPVLTKEIAAVIRRELENPSGA